MNHSSFIDDLLVPTIIIPHVNKNMHMYVNRKYFNNIILRTFLNWGNSIPVEVYNAPDKKEINDKAFKDAIHFLKKGEIVGIYPEGHRTSDGELQQARNGAVKLAASAKVPIVPIAITGSREILPKGKSLPKLKRTITLTIGKPITLKSTAPESFNNATRSVMKEIAALLGKEYRF